MTSSPAKPWENNADSAAAGNVEGRKSNSLIEATPALPDRPNMNSINTNMNNINSQYAGNHVYGGGINGMGGTIGNNYGVGVGGGYGGLYGNSTYGTGAYGAGAYGTAGYGGGYGSRYSSAFGTGMYGGGGYGGGNFGGAGYGAGSMYGNRLMGNNFNGPVGPNGMPIGPDGNEMSFTQRMELSTQSTFQILDQVVQAFGGFSQMLESTFFATHSSFMAMMGVAEQFGHLRNYLSQIFSMISLYKAMKSMFYRITGQPIPLDPSEITTTAFLEGLIFGLPYLFAKLIKHLEENKSKDNNYQNQARASGAGSLEFCKAQYDYQSDNRQDLTFKKGDLIAILSKGAEGDEWWQGRTQEGRMGLFPRNRVEMIPAAPTVDSQASTATLTSD